MKYLTIVLTITVLLFNQLAFAKGGHHSGHRSSHSSSGNHGHKKV